MLFSFERYQSDVAFWTKLVQFWPLSTTLEDGASGTENPLKFPWKRPRTLSCMQEHYAYIYMHSRAYLYIHMYVDTSMFQTMKITWVGRLYPPQNVTTFRGRLLAWEVITRNWRDLHRTGLTLSIQDLWACRPASYGWNPPPDPPGCHRPRLLRFRRDSAECARARARVSTWN